MVEAVFWTEERDEYLRERWLTDSAAVIGRGIGKTRSAVLSRARRLKLPRKEPGFKNANKIRRPRRARHNKGVPGQQTISRYGYMQAGPSGDANHTIPSIREFDAVFSAAQSQASPKALCELRRDECRWPINSAGEPGRAETLFCGDQVIGRGPYCAAHKKIASG